jgi:hypothetical protein
MAGRKMQLGLQQGTDEPPGSLPPSEILPLDSWHPSQRRGRYNSLFFSFCYSESADCFSRWPAAKAPQSLCKDTKESLIFLTVCKGYPEKGKEGYPEKGKGLALRDLPRRTLP